MKNQNRKNCKLRGNYMTPFLTQKNLFKDIEAIMKNTLELEEDLDFFPAVIQNDQISFSFGVSEILVYDLVYNQRIFEAFECLTSREEITETESKIRGFMKKMDIDCNKNE